MESTTNANRWRRRAWLGLASFYAVVFVALGLFIQFFPLWLQRVRGLGPLEVAWVFAAQTAARTIAGPLWAQRSDRAGRPRSALIGLSVLSLAAFSSFGLAKGPWALIGCGALFGCFYPAIHPIHDALSMAASRRGGFSYPRVRLIGSLAFLVTVLVAGWSLRGRPADAVFGWLFVVLGVQCLVAPWLPDVRHAPAAPGPNRPPIRELLTRRSFVLLLFGTGLIQGSHAVYYNLSTIHWCRFGVSEAAAGRLWAEGVLAEILLFYFARRAVERVRPTTMMLVGGGFAVLRWSLLGLTTELGWLYLINWMHALSFGLTYLGVLRAVERRVPQEQRATAQGLCAAASSGLGLVFAGLLGGALYERYAGGAFFAMAGLAALGVGLTFVLRRTSHVPNNAQAIAP